MSGAAFGSGLSLRRQKLIDKYHVYENPPTQVRTVDLFFFQKKFGCAIQSEFYLSYSLQRKYDIFFFFFLLWISPLLLSLAVFSFDCDLQNV